MHFFTQLDMFDFLCLSHYVTTHKHPTNPNEKHFLLTFLGSHSTKKRKSSHPLRQVGTQSNLLIQENTNANEKSKKEAASI